ncbi:MAG: proteasome accessory factor [Actinomycetota bacterium]|jgi:proteasome accessory factor C|nr:proteasome accessory factor [Actinomycetota bacterium]
MTEPSERLARRLKRILLLVPYAIKHPGVSVDELSAKFGIKRNDLVEDLNLLFMCGLPGYGPGDLIDVEFDSGFVHVRMADYFAAPLRLTPVEALALYAGGAAMASMPEMEEADALRRALAKLGVALGTTDEGASLVDVRFEADPSDHLKAIQTALADRKRLLLEYFSASSGEISTREVDPWSLYAALGRWYLVALDHLSAEERMFRVDRIKSATVMDAAADIPDDFDPTAYSGAFRERPGQPRATFEISPAVARWFEEYYPVRSASTLPDGWRSVELAYTKPQWVAALVLSIGDGVRAIAPQQIADAVTTMAKEVSAVYA